jgi:N utilization substance protein B
MQALYSFFQAESSDMPAGEREMMRSIDRAYELYLLSLLFIAELKRAAQMRVDLGKEKMLPTQEDLNPNLKFVNNRVLSQLEAHPRLHIEAQQRKLGWQRDEDQELIRKVWDNIRNWDAYKEYMSAEEDNYQRDQEFILEIFKKQIADEEAFEYFLEERNMHWPGDMNLAVAPAIIRTLESSKDDVFPELAPLFRDPEDDKRFVVDLFRRTILENDRFSKLIADKTKNWDVERIALMDVILMKMALTELVNFTSIPVKVSLNEYIEISKTYSTPKSRQFINGILDKLVLDMKSDGSIRKTGRGLLE